MSLCILFAVTLAAALLALAAFSVAWWLMTDDDCPPEWSEWEE